MNIKLLVTFVKDVTVALAAAVLSALVFITAFVVNQSPVSSVRQADWGLAGGVGMCRGRSLAAALGTMQPKSTRCVHTVC